MLDLNHWKKRSTAVPMPFVVRSDSENEAELEFLSPEEEAPRRKEPQQDQGATQVK